MSSPNAYPLVSSPGTPRRFRVFTQQHLEQIPELRRLSAERRFEMQVVASVLPFRVNEYVIEDLIDWRQVPDDPMFQLTFPQKGMLAEADFNRMADLHRTGASRDEIRALADEIRAGLNPHPAGQQELNAPSLDGEVLRGLQHKYQQTVLFFPSQGQTCHSYCTFCFRWAQFVGDPEIRFAESDGDLLQRYLREHREVSDLLVTGGDPMVMNSRLLAGYLEPLLRRDFDHVSNIRIGTKSLTFWPQRFVSDPDADEVLRLFERLVRSGKQLALMAHFDHWREMETPIVRHAIRRIRNTGAVIRSQAPLLRHINDDPKVWTRMWSTQVRLGVMPYYMFVERDTGARRYFEVPLVRAWNIYRQAMQGVSGLGRTARGPSMSAGPGKVEVQGVSEIGGEKVFVLRFLQARRPDWVQRPFFARFDSQASWLDDLKPAFGEKEFFFEAEYRALCDTQHSGRRVGRWSRSRPIGWSALAR